MQDPSYPVYVDSSVIMGMTGGYEEGRGFGGIQYMPCRPDTDFFPDLAKVSHAAVFALPSTFASGTSVGRNFCT